jgi:hypothetical protein
MVERPGGLVEVGWQEWLGNAIPVPPTHGQAETGPIIGRAAEPEAAANETRAIMGVS